MTRQGPRDRLNFLREFHRAANETPLGGGPLIVAFVFLCGSAVVLGLASSVDGNPTTGPLIGLLMAIVGCVALVFYMRLIARRIERRRQEENDQD